MLLEQVSTIMSWTPPLHIPACFHTWTDSIFPYSIYIYMYIVLHIKMHVFTWKSWKIARIHTSYTESLASFYLLSQCGLVRILDKQQGFCHLNSNSDKHQYIEHIGHQHIVSWSVSTQSIEGRNHGILFKASQSSESNTHLGVVDFQLAVAWTPSAHRKAATIRATKKQHQHACRQNNNRKYNVMYFAHLFAMMIETESHVY